MPRFMTKGVVVFVGFVWFLVVGGVGWVRGVRGVRGVHGDCDDGDDGDDGGGNFLVGDSCALYTLFMLPRVLSTWYWS